MKIRNLIALLLAVLTVAAVFVSCGDTGTAVQTTEAAAQTDGQSGEESTGDPTLDKEGYKKDDLAESYNFNKEVTILYDKKTGKQEFFAETTNGDAVNDALYSRNAGVEKRLGVTLTFVGESGNDGNQEVFLKTAQTDAASGDSQYVVYSAYSRTIPLLAMNGLCANLIDTQYINVEQPWWPKALTYECTINDCLYFCTGDISTNMLWMMSCLFYNKNLWTNANIQSSPEEMVKSGEWVLDKFIDVTKDFYTDNGDGKVGVDDTFGLCGYTACYDAFLNAANVITIRKNNQGELELNPDFYGERTATLVSKLGTLFKQNSVHWSSTSSNERAIFIGGRSLFFVDGTFIVTNVEGESSEVDYGIVPLPKYDAEQTDYVTNLRYPFNFYSINKITTEKDVASAVIEALASASYRQVTPVLFEVTMKLRYSAGDITSEMYDILREGIVFDFGRIYGYSLTNYYPDFRNQCFAGGTAWGSAVAVTKKKMPSMIKKITDTYSE